MKQIFNKGFRELIAWQEAKKLTMKVYCLTRKFPKEELFGLVSQLRRASSSVMANIAEGSAMPTKAHRDSFYYRARGSATEVDSFAELSLELVYLTAAERDDLCDHCRRIVYLITRLIG
ncbi:MAG: four helix bundle protein [Candidatus Peribacteraceae bacterium]|nr:four helix bundle protein [Candidatus Peribacteraceae bacterium]